MAFFGGGTTSAAKLSGAQQSIAQIMKRFLRGEGEGTDPEARNRYLDTPIGSGATPFEGPLTAGLPQEVLQARELLQSNFDPAAFSQSQGAALERALSGESAFDLSEERTAELFDAGVRAPAMRAWERDVVPMFKESFAGFNSLFSSRAGEAIVDAGRDVTLGLDAQLAQAQIGNQRFQAQLAESAAQRQAGAIPMASALRMEPFAQAQSLAGFGGIFQTQEQNEIDAAFREFVRTAPENDPFTQLALQFTGQGHVTPVAKGPGEGAQIASLALGGVNMMAGSGLLGSVGSSRTTTGLMGGTTTTPSTGILGGLGSLLGL